MQGRYSNGAWYTNRTARRPASQALLHPPPTLLHALRRRTQVLTPRAHQRTLLLSTWCKAAALEPSKIIGRTQMVRETANRGLLLALFSIGCSQLFVSVPVSIRVFCMRHRSNALLTSRGCATLPVVVERMPGLCVVRSLQLTKT